MKFQLVLQFPAAGMKQFDELVALKDNLIPNLPAACELDGHDSGSGEFNIFILTDQPNETFSAAQNLLQQGEYRQQLKAAYREQGNDAYMILWPPHLDQFHIV